MKRALVLVLLAGIATLLPQAGASASAAPDRQAPQLTANCQHSSGAGAVRSAGAVTLYSDPSVRVGAVQLCKDSSSRFWGYLTLDQPLAAGRWANAYIEAYWNGEYQATYSCAGNDIGYIKPNERVLLDRQDVRHRPALDLLRLRLCLHRRLRRHQPLLCRRQDQVHLPLSPTVSARD